MQNFCKTFSVNISKLSDFDLFILSLSNDISSTTISSVHTSNIYLHAKDIDTTRILKNDILTVIAALSSVRTSNIYLDAKDGDTKRNFKNTSKMAFQWSLLKTTAFCLHTAPQTFEPIILRFTNHGQGSDGRSIDTYRY